MDRTSNRIFAATQNVALRTFAEKLAEKQKEIDRLRADKAFLLSLLRTTAKAADCEGTVNELLGQLVSGNAPEARRPEPVGPPG